MKLLIINGPNLNRQMFSDLDLMGQGPVQMDYDGLVEFIHLNCEMMEIETEFYQSNHEGDLIDEIQSAGGRADGIILNAAGYANYSVAILDAIRVCNLPVVEVVLNDPPESEPFRKVDVVAIGCQGRFAGEGIMGYLHAAVYLAQLIRLDGAPHAHIVM